MSRIATYITGLACSVTMLAGILFAWPAAAEDTCPQADTAKGPVEEYSEKELERLSYELLGKQRTLDLAERRAVLKKLEAGVESVEKRRALALVLLCDLRSREDRASESLSIAKRFENLLANERDMGTWALCFGCLAYAFESPEQGPLLESKWFAKVRKDSIDIQEAYIAGLASAQPRWDRSKDRFDQLKELYSNEKISGESRELIIDLIGGGMMPGGGLEMMYGFTYFRKLAALPVNTPELNDQMFKFIEELGYLIHVSRVMSEPEQAKQAE